MYDTVVDKLTDFKPLERVVLPELRDLPCTGLVLIVGPKSSGKTRLLRDIHLKLSGQPGTLVVAERIDIRKPEYDPFYRCLIQEGYLTEDVDDAGNPRIRPTTAYLGTGQGAEVIDPSQVQSWLNRYEAQEATKGVQKVEFLSYFGRMLITALFLDRRLNIVNETPGFDAEKESPSNDLHALYLSDKAQTELAAEIRLTFSRALWLDPSRLKYICLRVSDSQDIPISELRRSPKAMSQYRAIDTEGDGLKSYVATCVALLLGRRPVCLIDEPEMCLHPPQAYNLGRFIGKHGDSSANATFVATHSSHVLRGVIQATQELQIVRLTRWDGTFRAHLVPSGILRDILARPAVRAETILDGIFAEAIAIVEADSDRAVYQATWETLAEEIQLELHFAPVGGTGGIAETGRLYRALKIPVVVITDLDIIADSKRLQQVVTRVAGEGAIDDLVNRTEDIAKRIKRLPPTISEAKTSEALAVAAAKKLDWSVCDDETMRQELLGIARSLDRMRRLKRGGVDQLPAGLRPDVTSLIEDLRNLGIFLVPVGELEEWLSKHGIRTSKDSKWAWANEAATLIRNKGSQEGDIWDFMRVVGEYLKTTMTDRIEGRATARVIVE